MGSNRVRGARDDVFEQQPKLGNVPLPVAQLIQLSTNGFCRVDLEGPVEGPACRLDAKMLVENHERVRHRVHDGLQLGMPCTKHAIKVVDVHQEVPAGSFSDLNCEDVRSVPSHRRPRCFDHSDTAALRIPCPGAQVCNVLCRPRRSATLWQSLPGGKAAEFTG